MEVTFARHDAAAGVRVGRVRLPAGTLDVYWLDAYGGGLFVPFRDATGRHPGRTGEGAADNPSCHQRDDWTCPLPPPGNWLDVRVEAGERSFPGRLKRLQGGQR